MSTTSFQQVGLFSRESEAMLARPDRAHCR